MSRNAFFHAALILIVFATLLAWPTARIAANESESPKNKPESAAKDDAANDQTDPQIRKILEDLAEKGRMNAPTTNEPEQTPQPARQEADASAPLEQKTWPGVVNKLIRKGGNGAPSINIYYPAFGNAAVDKAIAQFAEQQVRDYEEELKDSLSDDGEKPASYDMWDMVGYFDLLRPNPDIVSVTFNIYTYSGGAHGNLEIRCLNYDLRAGKPVDFADLFKDPEKALTILHELSPAKLRASLGDDADEEMIASGTTDDLTNFSNLSLAPDGLNVEFQPYQVGPWSIGAPHAFFSLEELAPAGPEENIWPPKKEARAPEKED